MMSYEVDDQTKFRNSTSYARSSNAVLQNMYGSSKNNIYKTFVKRKHNVKEIETQYKKVFEKDLDTFDIETPFDIVEWEDNIIYDQDESEKNNETDVSPLIKEFVDSTLEEDWDKYVIFNDEVQTKYKTFPTLYLDDPNLIFDKVDDKKILNQKREQKNIFLVINLLNQNIIFQMINIIILNLNLEVL
ncbi:transcription initiation factor tfiid 111kda subunit [Vairimorpha apis BRL 01]|uniref:Transcription initiation factor tfiid 111kda subunit n=1 Tax=Vairimorpha apis BRL 01 TaxID=1037528 RepID=T0L2C2_9MICR|nr:transcription initiation factor tfiid 111kda subunit [Vairimorpha apis BRL 01]